MSLYNWGSIQLGRILLRETFTVSEEQGGNRSLTWKGRSHARRSRAAGRRRTRQHQRAHPRPVIPVTFTDKPERSGYYMVKSAASTLIEYRTEMLTADWKVALDRIGSVPRPTSNSRLTGVVRLNDFSLTGERWHAPPIGHYAYYTGSTTRPR
jgi:hypothetical protein